MKNTLSIFDEYFPKDFFSRFSVRKAYVGKLGYIEISFDKDFLEIDNSDIALRLEKYPKELYLSLSKSPHVMEISPNLDVLVKTTTESAFTISRGSCSLENSLKLRVALPKRKSEELFQSGKGKLSCPEQFSVYFDGSIFFAVSEIESVPVRTDIGQVTREFLKETLENSTFWDSVKLVPPIPMRAEIYFLEVESIDNSNLENEFPIVLEHKNDLYVLVSGEIPTDKLIEYFLKNSHHAISYFYKTQITDEEISIKFSSLTELNQDLSELLADYFQQNTALRLFSKIPKKLRQNLSKMHLLLQEISTLELLAERQKREATELLQITDFLKLIQDYIELDYESYKPIDINAQLTLMNFAAQETSNLIIIQATLLAALIGAILGGLVTLISVLNSSK